MKVCRKGPGRRENKSQSTERKKKRKSESSLKGFLTSGSQVQVFLHSLFTLSELMCQFSVLPACVRSSLIFRLLSPGSDPRLPSSLPTLSLLRKVSSSIGQAGLEPTMEARLARQRNPASAPSLLGLQVSSPHHTARPIPLTCFEALQEAFPRRQFVRVVYDALGDFKHCAHGWNPEAGHLAQGEHVGGEPVHEHCLREQREDAQSSVESACSEARGRRTWKQHKAVTYRGEVDGHGQDH